MKELYCPIVLFKQQRAFKIIESITPSFDTVGFIKPQFSDDKSYINYLGDCITFKISKEIELLTTSIDVCIIDYCYPVSVLKDNARERFLKILTESNMFNPEKLIRGISDNVNDYFNQNINEILLQIINIIDIYKNMIVGENNFYTLDIGNLTTLIRELIRITIYKIKSYIENSFR